MNEPQPSGISENNAEKTYTHKGMSDILGVSETTVKSYRRKFPGCIPVVSRGKPIRFNESALLVATRIRDHFATGMSVEEVRLRLCAEFSWIGPEEEKSGQRPELPEKHAPELSQGMSNVAKSMVTLIQQQKNILQRVQVIEGQLEELGLKGVAVESLKDSTRATAQTAEIFSGRLDRLDSVTETLAGTVFGLADKLDRFLGDRAKSREDWQKNRDSFMKEAGEALGPHAGSPSAKPLSAGPPSASSPSTVVSFQAAQALQAQKETRHGFPSDKAAPDEPAQTRSREDSPEPPRTFLAHAMVVRTVDGRYISAGAKGRGRFSLNDLKALLVYGFAPPMHYTMHWEPHGEGWWLYLEQPGNPESERLSLLLMELSTSRGENVIEILQLRRGEETVHPAEICGIIDSIVL